MELYIKYPTDPNYDPYQVQTNSEIEMLITQIQTILFTNTGEVMGNYRFGCDLEKLIYDFNASTYNVKSIIIEQKIYRRSVSPSILCRELAKTISKGLLFCDINKIPIEKYLFT